MTITLDDELSLWLSQEANRQGRRADEVAARLLRDSMEKLSGGASGQTSVMEFAGIGAGRPGALRGKDAQEYVNEMRAEWEEREREWDR